jgi:hypothetical protein
MNRKFLPLLLAIPLVLLLAGCQIGTKIEVTQADGSVSFVVTRDDGDSVCVREIDVSYQDTKGTFHNVWSQSFTETTKTAEAGCRRTFVFGRSESNYTETHDGQPLVAGRTYSVSVSGAGMTGETLFKATG